MDHTFESSPRFMPASRAWEPVEETWQFVTLCTRDRGAWFGSVADGAIRLSPLGAYVTSCWHDLPLQFPGLRMDAFVVMPNHVHGLLLLPDAGDHDDAEPGCLDDWPPEFELPTRIPDPVPTLGNVLRIFKGGVLGWCRRNGHAAFAWQRRIQGHAVRGTSALRRMRRYIARNPDRWRQSAEEAIFF